MAVASDRWVQNVIRCVGLASVGASAYVFSLYPGCGAKQGSVCAGYAFGSQWLLRSERSIATLVVLVIVLTIVVRVVIIGTVPDQIGQTGAGWSESPETIRRINKTVDGQNEAIKALRAEAEHLTSSAAQRGLDLIDGLDERVSGLERSIGARGTETLDDEGGTIEP